MPTHLLRVRLGTPLAAAALLAGCTTTSPTLDAAKVDGGKALAVAYDGLNAAAKVTRSQIDAGVLKGANEQRAGAYLGKARKILDAADDAYKLGTSTDPTQAIQQATALFTDVAALAQGKETPQQATAAATAAAAAPQ